MLVSQNIFMSRCCAIVGLNVGRPESVPTRSVGTTDTGVFDDSLWFRDYGSLCDAMGQYEWCLVLNVPGWSKTRNLWKEGKSYQLCQYFLRFRDGNNTAVSRHRRTIGRVRISTVDAESI